MDEDVKADCQLTIDIYKHHTGYRFTIFGFFVTVMLAVNGAIFYVISSEKAYAAGVAAAILATVIVILAITMDRRTVQLYEICLRHARHIEEGHFFKKGHIPKEYKSILTVIEEADPVSITNAFRDTLTRMRNFEFGRHTLSIRILYILSLLSCWFTVLYRAIFM